MERKYETKLTLIDQQNKQLTQKEHKMEALSQLD